MKSATNNKGLTRQEQMMKTTRWDERKDKIKKKKQHVFIHTFQKIEHVFIHFPFCWALIAGQCATLTILDEVV